MKVYIEGKTDRAIPKALGIPSSSLFDQGGIGNVINKVAREENVIGIIDEDPGQPKPRSFEQFYVDKDEQKYHLKFYRHKSNNLLIVLCPKLELWILKVAELAKIDIVKHRLANEPSQLRIDLRNDRTQAHLSAFVTHLINQNNPVILYLQNILVKEYVQP